MAQKRKIIVSIMLAVVLAVLGGVMAACGGTKSFTVTFDSNGGSAVEAVKVEDGKFVEKPADPTRENYNFLGWMDEENNAFAFESTKITADITL
ncbi:MAG: InlB B-repeat-containing protein, partial [Clostridia bacterium]|nr:InlB B-repeat-containing protein [Clostridia bacterium]